MEIVKIAILSLSALMLVFVGVMRLSNPIKTYLKNSGIKLENDASLLNEMRGVAAVMLCAGIIVLLGTFIEKLAFNSHLEHVRKLLIGLQTPLLRLYFSYFSARTFQVCTSK